MRKIGLLIGFLFLASISIAQAPDDGWPREIACCGARLVIYQPQIDQWTNDLLKFRSAVTLLENDGPLYGIVSLSARTDVDKESRTVVLAGLQITEVKFPAAGLRQLELADSIRQDLSVWPRTISLDRLLASLSVTQSQAAAATLSLKNEPPRIIFSNVASTLVLIDGEPVFRPVQGTRYTRVINTPALLLFDPDAGRFYLDGVRWWMTAPSLNGGWSVSATPPADLEQLKASLADGEEQDPHTHPQDLPPAPPAMVYVSTVPAELIETKGEPRYSPIPKTQLVYVTNTDRQLFLDVKSQVFYVLLAGRWFETKNLEGPWSYLSGAKLPRDFRLIPPGSAKGDVLASIPGTEQAQEAVIANQIPQTAAVKRSNAGLKVRYDGDPKFKPVEGTSMEYAVNTDSEVLYAQGRYWVCSNAVWFVSDSPLGPWEVTDTIPAEVYSIPPSSPFFHLRYVSVYNCTPDYVYFGYTPGYLGSFISDDVVVYGTGWWYPGWYGNWWFGWPWTWGFGFDYSYWGGGWFWRPVGYYWWNHSPWFMHRVYHEHWNPHWHPGDRNWIRNNVNVYNRWPRNAVVPRTDLRRSEAVRPTNSPQRRRDVYAGRDGQIYERRQGGWYQQNNSGAWRKVTPNRRLERQHQSRSLGELRRNEFQNRGQVRGIPRTVAPRPPASRSVGPPPSAPRSIAPRGAAPMRPSAPTGRRR